MEKIPEETLHDRHYKTDNLEKLKPPAKPKEGCRKKGNNNLDC